MGLTPSQRAAVIYDRNLILFAGPGSGKTATTIAKGRRVLTDEQASLCMVTFTAAAAGEMAHRMEADFKDSGQAVPRKRLMTGTFHSIALRHYQRHVKNCPKLLAPPARSAMVQTMLSRETREGRSEITLSLEQYQGALDPTQLDLPSEHMAFILEYLKKLRTVNATDLATVMRDCTMRMAAGEIPLLPITHLIADEQQDADEVQLEFILNHTRRGVTTTLVADDDQTIYEWRSALGYTGLQRFASETGAKTIVLAENFRSRQEVIKHAAALIAHNDPHRIEKTQQAVRGVGGVLGVLKSSNTRTECELVAAAIAQYKYEDEEIAILARSNKALEIMEEALSAEEIPYRRDGPSMWDSAEVGCFVALLRALVTSRAADLLPILVLLPVDAKVRDALERHLGRACGSFLDGEVPDIDCASPVDKEVLTRFASGTASWRRLLRAGDYNLSIPDVGSAVAELLRQHAGLADDSAPKSRRINLLVSGAVNVLTRLSGTLSQRLVVISRMQQVEPGSFPVRLMTMHGSKGLEFDTVFLINASKPDDGSTLMEDQPERRLFYVAMTRAKERFFATYSDEPVKYVFEAKLPGIHSFDEVLAGDAEP